MSTLREDLKNYDPMRLLWGIVSYPAGHVISNEEYNERLNLLSAQGDDTVNKLKDTLDMLYETVLNDLDGSEHIMFDDPDFAANNVKLALLELSVRIASNLGLIQTNDTAIQTNATNLTTHKGSADHDGRYYTEAESDATEAALQSDINSNTNALNTHKGSSDHDDRYYTESESDAFIAALQLLIDQNISDIALKANIADVYSKINMQTSGQATVHWDNLTNVPAFGDDQWKTPVANEASLPLVGNTDGDLRMTLDTDIVWTWNEDPGEWVEIGASGSGITSHGQLLNLNNDDHVQYLRHDGTRAMTGNLELAGFALLNALMHPSSTQPTPTEGKLWYDSNEHTLKVYNGTAWANVVGAGALVQHIELTASDGQTVFDVSAGGSQSYNTGDGTLEVFIKNAEGRYELLDKDDYTETDSETVTLNTPASLGDEYYFKWQKNLASIVNSIGDGEITDNKLDDNAGAIKDQVNQLQHMYDAGGTSVNIAINMPGVDAYTNMMKLTFVASADNGASPTTLNINGLGTRPIYKPGTTDAPNITNGKAYEVWYNATGSCFFHKASAEGNADVSHVLAGKTFSNDNDTGLIGTMIHRITASSTLVTDTLKASTNLILPIPYNAYFEEGHQLYATDNSWVEPNIKSGVNIFGKVGTLVPSPIKSIQHVSAVITAGNTSSGNIGINSVNYSKSAISNLYFKSYSSGAPTNVSPKVKLIDGSNVRAERWGSPSTVLEIEFDVIEFEDYVDVQHIESEVTPTVNATPISPVSSIANTMILTGGFSMGYSSGIFVTLEKKLVTTSSLQQSSNFAVTAYTSDYIVDLK